jgi:hypothetical protein
MNELAAVVLGVLLLPLLLRARMRPARRRSRARWPGPGILVTRGPLNRWPTGPAWGHAWGRPWR